MARTLQNIVDRVRLITGDRTSAQFQDSDIARWATDGQLDLVRSSETGKTDFNGASIVGQNTYPVAGGFVLVESVFYDGARLVRRSREEMDQQFPYRLQNPTTNVAQPQYYWLTKDTVNLYPTPDVSGKVIVVTLVPRPADLVLVTDPLTVPDEMMETIVRACLQKASEWGEDWAAAQYFRTDVKERTGEDRFIESQRGSDSYPVIRDAPGENW